MAVVREVLVVCGQKLSAGITAWDLEGGGEEEVDMDDAAALLRIPTCASPPHGLLFIRNQQQQLLVASQLQSNCPLAGGAIFFWPLHKPQAPYRSYTVEAIGPIAISKEGIYLVGGAPSGNAHIWEVTSGRLLRSWHAHRGSVSCLAFSHDDSFLISGAEDGEVCVWSMIRVLNTEDSQACGRMLCFHNWPDHGSPVTGLLPVSGGSTLALISSSLDGTCKVWDLVSGRLLQIYVFSVAVTAVALDPGGQLLFTGREDGRIYVRTLDLGLQENVLTVLEDESGVLCGHKEPITALTFNSSGVWLISASKDCTACLWDVRRWQLIRRFRHRKGHITNLAVIPHSSLSTTENQRNYPRNRIAILDKTPKTHISHEGTLTHLPVYCSHEELLPATNFRSSSLLSKQIVDLEQGRTVEAIEMKVETCVENRLLTISMTKHMNAINQNLQSRLLDMMHHRLCPDLEVVYSSRRDAKTQDFEEKPGPST